MGSRASKTILVADRDDFFKGRLCEVFVQEGHKTKVAGSGMEVLALIENSVNNLDFLVMDHSIPPSDSFWILDWINNNKPKNTFPILILSQDTLSDAQVSELRNHGATGIMSKHFSHDQIAYQVNQILFKPVHSRVSPRVSISIPAEFSYGKRTEKGRILNMSENGLFWYSRIRHKPGTEITAKFTLPGQNQELNIKGVVMRYRRMGELNNLFTEVGLKFDTLSDIADSAIKGFLSIQIDNIYPRDE